LRSYRGEREAVKPPLSTACRRFKTTPRARDPNRGGCRLSTP
jgi:hypothetical protein